ncbi:uncharacterized protein BJ212DRAFT_1487266 [Suillus subaureus]|uniref:Uncharacterized protein n=1 Tax=Suillus subaureus TaxID=48587 RepID=A0A9P7DU98_9AGAM|nr:uncharacterized protein BJ212DRAFT_1487266 [Suillus subaureus]KAG1802975.1 hypothetical protein BJ212DRAFT_1487266 [Suillus subaureus]
MQILNSSKLVQKAWAKCTANEWNLSAKCLTSKKAKAALEINVKIGNAVGIDLPSGDGLVGQGYCVDPAMLIEDEDIGFYHSGGDMESIWAH